MLFIDIFLASLCLMSRITMIEARPMPQYLHTFHPTNHTPSATTKMSIHQRIRHPHHPPVIHQSKPSLQVKRIMNATMSANNPVASAKAKPKMAYANNCPLMLGLRATPVIKAPKTVPIPTPAPARPIVARPVPMLPPAMTMASASSEENGRTN